MEITIKNEELVKQSLFDKEKIKSICDRYIDKIIISYTKTGLFIFLFSLSIPAIIINPAI